MQFDSTNVQGKVVVITGASSGLGEATARYLAARGAAVVLGARRVERLQAFVNDITRAGGRAFSLATDVTNPAQVQALVDAAVERYGRVEDRSVISEGLRQEVKPCGLRTTIISPGAVATELPNSVMEPDVAAGIGQFYAEYAVPADSFARAVAYAIQPEDVDINEILYRPTRQEL